MKKEIMPRDMVADVNHNINNPLTIIYGLAMKLPEGEEKNQMMRAIKRIADYCQSLDTKEIGPYFNNGGSDEAKKII